MADQRFGIAAGRVHRQSSLAPLSRELSTAGSQGLLDDGEDIALLPAAGSHHHHRVHKHSLSAQLDNQWHSFNVAMFKPSEPALLEGGVGAEGSEASSNLTNEPFITIHDLQPSKQTSEWLMVGITLLPKFSWGWLPFCFSFLRFSVALKLLLFQTLFSVFSAAILYRLYLHNDKQGILTLADIGEAAFGKRLGRRPVQVFTRIIDVAVPCILHVAGTRFLQAWLFYTTGVCLPWISLLFGLVVLGLVQIQGLGGHPAMTRIVQPVLTALAVAATVVKLLLVKSQQDKALQPDADVDAEDSLPYVSDYVIAVVQLVFANYMGQHTFMQTMSGMSSPASFQHSTAWAQVITLILNLLVAIVTLRIQNLHLKGFISFAFGPDLLSRFVNFLMWLMMTAKYVTGLHASTKSLLPRLPHLLVQWIDPDGIDSDLHIKPRQLWLLCSSIVVFFSFIVSGTFPHTFMLLSCLLVSLAYIPMTFTLPCLFSLKLLSNQITALEYCLSTWVVPVSIILSIMGCWASLYQMGLKWNSVHHGGSWGCNLLHH